MTKIHLTDSINDMFFKLSEGNPGALRVLADIYKEGQDIDPYTDPIMLLLNFDSFNVYGSKIWGLYKYVCKQNLNKTIACIRACQLGIISKECLLQVIDARGDGVDLTDIYKRVKEQLPKFVLCPTE